MNTPRIRLIIGIAPEIAKRHGTAFLDDHILYMLPNWVAEQEDQEIKDYFRCVLAKMDAGKRQSMTLLINAIHDLAATQARIAKRKELAHAEARLEKAETLIALIEGAVLDHDWQRIEQCIAEFRAG